MFSAGCIEENSVAGSAWVSGIDLQEEETDQDSRDE